VSEALECGLEQDFPYEFEASTKHLVGPVSREAAVHCVAVYCIADGVAPWSALFRDWCSEAGTSRDLFRDLCLEADRGSHDLFRIHDLFHRLAPGDNSARFDTVARRSLHLERKQQGRNQAAQEARECNQEHNPEHTAAHKGSAYSPFDRQNDLRRAGDRQK